VEKCLESTCKMSQSQNGCTEVQAALSYASDFRICSSGPQRSGVGAGAWPANRHCIEVSRVYRLGEQLSLDWGPACSAKGQVSPQWQKPAIDGQVNHGLSFVFIPSCENTALCKMRDYEGGCLLGERWRGVAGAWSFLSEVRSAPAEPRTTRCTGRSTPVASAGHGGRVPGATERGAGFHRTTGSGLWRSSRCPTEGRS
jgi:hypothetical protein